MTKDPTLSMQEFSKSRAELVRPWQNLVKKGQVLHPLEAIEQAREIESSSKARKLLKEQARDIEAAMPRI